MLLNIGIQHDVGSQIWWKELYSIGMPIIQHQDANQCLVTLIWQDPEGNENTSTTGSVLLDVNSITDHHSWEPECLNRVVGTDVWFGQLTVNSKWRGSYSFIPLQAHQLPEIIKEQNDGSREAQRSWWVDVAQQQVHDALNPLPVQLTGWGRSSPLHLPNAPAELGWEERDKGQLATVSTDKILSIKWKSQILGNQRDCQLFSIAKGDAPLVILLDGQKWGEESGALAVLQYLTEQKLIAPAHYLLVPSIDGQTRWKELSCHKPFWQALVDEFLPDVESELAKVGSSISDYIVAGQSLGGLSSLYAGLQFPEYFSKIISLSGSFWWPEKSRMLSPKAEQELDSFSSLAPPENSLAELIQTGKSSVKHLEAFLTVGHGEQDMCLYNRMTYEAIKRQGGKVSLDIVYGGHDWLSWRSGLMNGLMHLLPKK
ncbi:enterochelin esterase [Marinomonas sp. 5E14-1]|uniref:enterochelin esterase n=1 Tax=Marinomonas sp. 5E14-1 TaxID=3153922 RepID=UPI003263486E